MQETATTSTTHLNNLKIWISREHSIRAPVARVPSSPVSVRDSWDCSTTETRVVRLTGGAEAGILVVTLTAVRRPVAQVLYRDAGVVLRAFEGLVRVAGLAIFENRETESQLCTVAWILNGGTPRRCIIVIARCNESDNCSQQRYDALRSHVQTSELEYD